MATRWGRRAVARRTVLVVLAVALAPIGLFEPPNRAAATQLGQGAAAISVARQAAIPTPTPRAYPLFWPTRTELLSQEDVASMPPPPGRGDARLFGVAVAGAEFAEDILPGIRERDYTYPTDPGALRYFADRGLTLIRVPFRWERLQRRPFGDLRTTDLDGLRAVLDAAELSGQQVILDMHNYGMYYDAPLTLADAAKLADVWQRIAQEFRDHPALYGYEIMNEPHGLSQEPDDFEWDCAAGSLVWAVIAQTVTDAIRQVDGHNWVLVPGYWYQSSDLWPRCNRTLDVRDRSQRVAYAAHVYFDRNGSGLYRRGYDAERAYVRMGEDRVRPFLGWLAERGARGIVTEYGIPDSDERWLPVLDHLLAVIAADGRLLGGVYWAAGPWWDKYPLSVEPRNGRDRPQLAILERYPSRR